MVLIELKDVDLEIPVFDYRSQSLRRRLAKLNFQKIEQADARIKKIQVLRQVTLSAQKGDRIGVMGANGAGKSSFLRMLSGIYEPTGGSLNVTGSVLAILSISDGLEPELTGRENIYRVGLMRGYALAHLTVHEAAIIEFSGLGEFIDLPVRTYSSGMQLRLVFAVVTSIQLDILLLDEFFAAGDEDFRQKSKKRIDELIDNAKVLIFASHSIELIKQYCNRILIFEKGQVDEMDMALL